MSQPAPQKTVLRVADLPQNSATAFDLKPDEDMRARIAADLDLPALRKLAFSGEISASGRRGWRLEGTLGATAEQACVVTLEPVVTRIDTPVTRLFTADYVAPDEAETEMPQDDNQELLGAEIDLGRVMVEALALALPDYPRKGDAALAEQSFAAPGVAPMSDAETKPFAGLAELRDKLGKHK